MSGCSPDQEVIVSACVRGYTITHPVPISAGLCHRNTGAMSAVFAPRRPPRKRAVLATGQQIILPFSCHSCSARSTNWQSGNLTKCALIQTTLRFVCRAVCDAQKPRNGGNFRDRMWECRTAHAHSDIPHLVRAAPRHPANASRHAKKFRVPLTVHELVKQKIAGAPPGFRFCD